MKRFDILIFVSSSTQPVNYSINVEQRLESQSATDDEIVNNLYTYNF